MMGWRSSKRFGFAACAAAALFACYCGGVVSKQTSDGGTSGGSAGCASSCPLGLVCCGDQCVKLANDPRNCGGCGMVCSGPTSLCDGECKVPACEQDAAACGGNLCCGSECCGDGQFCCQWDIGPPGPPQCYTPLDGGTACPLGCYGGVVCSSDRNLKRNVEPIDPRAVLDALMRLPISEWSYKNDVEAVRHIGPMAQDFRAIFGLGDTDRAYHPIDAHGVALAAIQGLYERVKEQDARIERLERDNAAIRKQCGGRSPE